MMEFYDKNKYSLELVKLALGFPDTHTVNSKEAFVYHVLRSSKQTKNR